MANIQWENPHAPGRLDVPDPIGNAVSAFHAARAQKLAQDHQRQQAEAQAQQHAAQIAHQQAQEQHQAAQLAQQGAQQDRTFAVDVAGKVNAAPSQAARDRLRGAAGIPAPQMPQAAPQAAPGPEALPVGTEGPPQPTEPPPFVPEAPGQHPAMAAAQAKPPSYDAATGVYSDGGGQRPPVMSPAMMAAQPQAPVGDFELEQQQQRQQTEKALAGESAGEDAVAAYVRDRIAPDVRAGLMERDDALKAIAAKRAEIAAGERAATGEANTDRRAKAHNAATIEAARIGAGKANQGAEDSLGRSLTDEHLKNSKWSEMSSAENDLVIGQGQAKARTKTGDALAIGILAKIAQGGAGIVNQKDIDMISRAIGGGWVGWAQDQINTAVGDGLRPESRKALEAAFANIGKSISAKKQEIIARGDAGLSNFPYWNAFRATLGAKTPAQGPGLKNAAERGGKKAPAKSLDDLWMEAGNR